MTEQQRRERNKLRLSECHPGFAWRVREILLRLEARGYRARIQDAHRSLEDQAAAVAAGRSKRRFGFHNVTGANGVPEALAVDILNDDDPLTVSKPYALALAIEARFVGCATGIAWGLPGPMWRAVEAAIVERDTGANVKIGWDPYHVQVAGMTLAMVQAGERPALRA